MIFGTQLATPSLTLSYNGAMIETFYQTDQPVKGVSECYVLVLTSRASSGRKVYAFMQEHGQWNDQHGRFIYEVDTIGTGETLSHQEALALYHEAKRELAERGFVHAFLPDDKRKAPRTDPRSPSRETVPA